MGEYIPPPDPRSLLVPLLACLPAAFACPRPPPALLPLLSPILRQRVQLLSGGSSSSSETWLRLLSWDSELAHDVERIIRDATFEPHPVSGEIEIPDDIIITYKRLDLETLRCRLPLSEFNLTVLYVWCATDQEGGGAGWRVAEVLPFDALKHEDAAWTRSIEEADTRIHDLGLQEAQSRPNATKADPVDQKGTPNNDDDDDDDDDDYWAQYDGTPAQTPGSNDRPSHDSRNTNDAAQPSLGNDMSYFNRYSDVQPALDGDDPTVDTRQIGDSSLKGDTLDDIFKRQMGKMLEQQQLSHSHPHSSSHPEFEPVQQQPSADQTIPLNHPRPSSASSSRSDAISRLEQSAENQSTSEMAVKQHISTNIKSLFRLGKSAGISRAEFASLVQRELEVLDLIDLDEY
ncbi:hypothetical protein FQN57_006138 [Myotisia sp. PD_48]|nr:hypothetical protein FQN57_006138 [Myotisia sp. PD_48]